MHQPSDIVFIWPLVAAAVLGACMGFERTLAGKHAGMRTYALVSLGSSLFVICGTLAAFQLSIFSGINPLAIASNVVVAIGFLGVGLSVFRGEHPVELTTAAGLWVVAGVGMACGFGFYGIAVTSTVLSIIIFSLLAKLENKLHVRLGKEFKD
ncbi:MAG: MgtC/SapB family protein [Patescibacteria group bacterium]|nr:MgtC/SapB family protein [Patescibacteria group bacterium]